MSNQEARFDQHVLVDTTPMPASIPPIKEIGSTSAPLLSAAYFIGARCRAYNDDYMQCKTEAFGRGELDCLKEGRKVTRCAASVLDDVTKNCLADFRLHWNCLENQNHQLWQCRREERRLNKCVFKKLSLTKTIPDAPPHEVPVHLRQHQIYATAPQGDDAFKPFFQRISEHRARTKAAKEEIKKDPQYLQKLHEKYSKGEF